MLRILILSILLAVVSSKRPTWRDLDNYSFKDYVSDFSLPIDPSIDYATREKLFLAELARVRSHNEMNKSWKEGNICRFCMNYFIGSLFVWICIEMMTCRHYFHEKPGIWGY